MDLYNYANLDPVNNVDPLGWHSVETYSWFDKAQETVLMAYSMYLINEAWKWNNLEGNATNFVEGEIDRAQENPAEFIIENSEFKSMPGAGSVIRAIPPGAMKWLDDLIPNPAYADGYVINSYKDELLDPKLNQTDDALINKSTGTNGGEQKVWPNLIPDNAPSGVKLKDPSSIKKNQFSGQSDFVITADGQLHVGQSHAYLANGGDVVSAGQATFKDGELLRLDNGSGHFKPHGVDPAIPESAFNNAGFNATGLYKEKVKYKK